MLLLLTLFACGGTPPADNAADEPAVKGKAKRRAVKNMKTKLHDRMMRAKHKKGGKNKPKEASSKCPDGVVVASSWPGEWPGPIVDVKKKTTFQAYTAPCAPAPTKACTVAKKVYHPWARDELKYSTVRAIERYEATKDAVVDSVPVKKGAVVAVHQYQGEGFCQIQVDGKSHSDECPDMHLAPEGWWKKLPGPDFEERQLFEVVCDEGGTALVEANEALKVDGVGEGTFPDYGSVAPGK